MDANPHHIPTRGCTCGCHALAPWLTMDKWTCDSCRHRVTDPRYTGQDLSRPLLICWDCENHATTLNEAGEPVCSVHAKG